MKLTFADTLYYVALLVVRDSRHTRARQFQQEYTGRYITTEFVLAETGNFFSHIGGRAAFVQLVAELRADPRTTIVPASADLFDRGLQLFAARPDKEWSLTDCTSFATMTDRGLSDALTADAHFRQAGFVPLLAD